MTILPTLTTRGLLVTFLLIAIFVMATQPLADTDLWWHLATGRWIMLNRAIPHFEPFSATKQGEPWVTHEWLADVGLYGLYQIGGVNALVLFVSLTVTLTTVFVYRLSVLRPHLAVFTTLLGALASNIAWSPRPHLLTTLFAALTLYLLQKQHNTHSRAIWLLPPLFLLWANVHSGFVLGLVIIGCVWLGEGMELFIGGLAQKQRVPVGFFLRSTFAANSFFMRLSFVMLAATAATLLNPQGVALLFYPFFTLTSKAMQTYILEWHSPNFHDARFLPFAALFCMTLMALAFGRQRPRAGELLLLMGATYEAFVSLRNIPFFALIAAPLITHQVQGLWQTLPSRSSMTPFSARLSWLNWMLVGLVVLVASVRVSMILVNAPTQLEKEFPESATAFVLNKQPAGPMLNSYNFGGYLIWRLYPTYQVFIDGRADVYGDTFMDEYYERAWQGRGDWQAYLDRYQINLIVMERDGALASLLRQSPRWRLAHQDDLAVVYQRLP